MKLNFKHKIELWGKVEQIDTELNAKTYVEQKVKDLWAEIIPTSGGTNTAQAQTIEANINTKFRIRSTDVLRNDMFIMYKGRRYNIRYFIQDYKNNLFIEIFAELLIE